MEQVCKWQIHNAQQRIVFMHTAVTNAYDDVRFPPVPDHTLCSSVKEWLIVFGFGPRLKDFLVIKDNCTVARRQVMIAVFGIIALFSFPFNFVKCLILQASYVVNLDGKNATWI